MIPNRVHRGFASLLLVVLGIALAAPGGSPASGAQKPGTAILYTGRGKGIKKVSFRLKGHKLIEATVVYFDRCTTTTRGDGKVGRYRLRQELTAASPRFPLRVDVRGRFRVFRSEVFFNADETELFTGKVTSRSIVGKFARESNESASESGIFDKCHTGGFGGPMAELPFHARRR